MFMEKEIFNITKEFFDKFWITINNIEILKEDIENIFKIKINTDDSWIIIWPYGKNLDSIWNILKIILSKKLWKNIKIHLEVNDYIKTKDERLQSYIVSKIQYVEKSWADLQLPFYSGYQRKKIHWFVAEYWNCEIYTKSIWEWKQRRLYICKKARKLSIDIDWNDI